MLWRVFKKVILWSYGRTTWQYDVLCVLILADEPTGNLDTENSAIVLNMFQEMNYRFNQTIIMITHNPEAAAMCRRIIQMRDGQIVEPMVSVQI